MNLGDPEEFTTIPSDSPAVTEAVGSDDDAPVMVEEDTEPYEPPAPGEESKPPEEYDEVYESKGDGESGEGEEEEEPEDLEGLKEQVGEEENVENEPVNVECKPQVIEHRAKRLA